MDFDDNTSFDNDLQEEEVNENLEEENEEEEEVEEVEQIDYTSILQEMNQRLENIESHTVDYTEAIQGILTNTYFLDFVGFTLFIFLMLFVVIKFFKIFF